MNDPRPVTIRAKFIGDIMNDPCPVTIRAKIARIRYSKNGYCIALATADKESRKMADGKFVPYEFTVLGAMSDPKVGQEYEFIGKLGYNDKFNSHEIKFNSYRTLLPDDKAGIITYLIDVAKWVGPAVARLLVDAFGDETLTVLKTEPDKVRALKIKGLKNDRIDEMRATLIKNEAIESATIEVNNMLSGILGPATVRKAICKWGCDAATIIKANPFVLTEIHGVGFTSADTVFLKLGGDPADVKRHAAGLLHVMGEAARKDGHTLVSVNRAKLDSAKCLKQSLQPETLDACVTTKAIVTNGFSVSLADLSDAEQFIVNKLAAMEAAGCREPVAINTEGLADDQIAAAKAFEVSPVFILTGAPGTGKTYTVARLVKSMRGETVLCAPTGKAAKQMSLALAGVCPGSASTIHSLLEPVIDEESGEFGFCRDENNPIEADNVIVDEYSMVDVRLCRALLKAIPDTARLLIVGDHYQLPSVGPGAVLRDLLALGVPSVELTEIKRNAGLIVRACHAIKAGQTPQPAAKLDLDAGDNWRHLEAGNADDIKATIATILASKLPNDLERPFDIQIISPTNERGPLSCDSLNVLAKPIFNPNAEPVEGLPFTVGDKVVRLKNAVVAGYEMKSGDAVTSIVPHAANVESSEVQIVNGDIGIVRHIDDKCAWVQLRYPDRLVRIRRVGHELKLAYCMTCHKMQGSEVPVVIMPLDRGLARMPMVTREWIYTAFSRAKQFIVTVGDLDAIRPIVAKIGTSQRRTTLEATGTMKRNGHKVLSN